MSRAVEEWIGKTPDTKVPTRVRLRVFEKYNGRCYLSGRKIGPADKWDLEDIIALINGGENRESNKAPALKEFHKVKTAKDVAEKSKVARIRAKHLGLHKSSRPFPKRADPWGKTHPSRSGAKTP